MQNQDEKQMDKETTTQILAEIQESRNKNSAVKMEDLQEAISSGKPLQVNSDQLVDISDEKVDEEQKKMEAGRQMAIIKNPIIGWDGDAGPGLRMTVYTGENFSSVQFLVWEEFGKLIESYKMYDVSVLENHPCWVYHDEEKGTITFLGLCVI